MGGMRALLVKVGLACIVLGSIAGAEALNEVKVGDLPGTNGQWQMGEVTVAAPLDEVQRWFTDASQWTARFPDDKKVQILGRAPDGRQIVEMKSAALGKTLTLRLREQPGLITYEGSGKGVSTQGKIFFQSLGPSRTKVIMQTTGELHGATGVFATEGMKRKRALAKLSSDLNATVQLARNYAAVPRRGG
jgi:hypothetical protein